MTLVDAAQRADCSEILDRWRAAVRGAGLAVALPDGEDPRALHAAVRLHEEGLVAPRLFGDAPRIRLAANTHEMELPDELIVDLADAMSDDTVRTTLETGFARSSSLLLPCASDACTPASRARPVRRRTCCGRDCALSGSPRASRR